MAKRIKDATAPIRHIWAPISMDGEPLLDYAVVANKVPSGESLNEMLALWSVQSIGKFKLISVGASIVPSIKWSKP